MWHTFRADSVLTFALVGAPATDTFWNCTFNVTEKVDTDNSIAPSALAYAYVVRE